MREFSGSIKGRRLNHARRQQRRRLFRAVKAGTGAVAATFGALGAARFGVSAVAPLSLLSAALALSCRRWLVLAGRSAAGARSEDEVQRELDVLRAEGWRLLHSLAWRGQGDIDSVAIAPTGVAIAVETKTRSYDDRHVARVAEQAVWLSRRRRRWARRGSLGVLCLVSARGVERVEHDVLVVSIDRLTHVLRVAAVLGPGARSSA
jgi:hypothetical protein